MAKNTSDNTITKTELKKKFVEILHNDFQTTPDEASDKQVYEALAKIGVGILKLLHKRLDRLVKKRVIDNGEILKMRQIGLDTSGEETAVILPCFHHYSKIRKLICTFIEVKSPQVVADDVLCRITLRISAGKIYLHQYIERINEDMTAAHTRIN